jgi:uncharacterized protein YjeT (DUF2065 family)
MVSCRRTYWPAARDAGIVVVHEKLLAIIWSDPPHPRRVGAVDEPDLVDLEELELRLVGGGAVVVGARLLLAASRDPCCHGL